MYSDDDVTAPANGETSTKETASRLVLVIWSFQHSVLNVWSFCTNFNEVV